MSAAVICFLIAVILMVLGSLPIPVPIDLWKLGWAFVILGAFVVGKL